VTDSATPRSRAHHVTDPLIEIDLFGELAALRSTDAYLSASHAAPTIAKQPGIRVVLIALKPGGRMHEHHAGASITVQGFDGRERDIPISQCKRQREGDARVELWQASAYTSLTVSLRSPRCRGSADTGLRGSKSA